MFPELSPGGAVVVTDGRGTTLATVPLNPGGTVQGARHTESERSQRSRLIEAVFRLRVAKKNRDAVGIALLRKAEADLKLHDLDNPDDMSFEGQQMQAIWCRLTFTASELPVSDSYTTQVGQRSPTVLTQSALEAQGWAVEEVVE